jgi:hypothetical protein
MDVILKIYELIPKQESDFKQNLALTEFAKSLMEMTLTLLTSSY